MKKKNIFLKTLSFGLLSSCFLGGLSFITSDNTSLKNETVSHAAYESISNKVPSFFKTSSNIYGTYAYVDYAKNEYVNFSFDVANYDDTANNIFQGTYYDGQKQLGFDITNISTSVNGTTLESIEYKDVIKSYDNAGNFPHSLNYFPESFNLYMSVNTASNDTYWNTDADGKENHLVLNEQGVVDIKISYTTYEMSPKIDDISILNIDNVKTNQEVAFTFLLLDRNTYLELGTSDAPNINYDKDIMTRTLSGSATYKYNYFYNYGAGSLPFIEYDPTNYEVNVTKIGQNNSATSINIIYDKEKRQITYTGNNGLTIENNDFSAQIVDNKIKIFFFDTGEYAIKYQPIFVNGNKTYSIGNTIPNQKVYLYGYQSYYTIKSATYGEFKHYNSEMTEYVNPADISYLFNNADLLPVDETNADTMKTSLNNIFNNEVFDSANPSYKQDLASTNQTPVKFETIEGVNPTQSYCYYSADNGNTWTKSNFTVVDNYSSAGKYLVVANYSFSSYTNVSGVTNSSKLFSQYFAFEITKKSPSIDVYTDEVENLEDLMYTNDTVYLQFDQHANIYNKSVRIELVRNDFYNEKTFSENIDWHNNGSIYNLVGDGIVSISNDGNYTINIYQQGTTNPIKRYFNIDTDDNLNLSAYTVEQSKTSQNNYATNPVNTITNQSMVFSWDNIKPSGATTKAYYRYYPITSNSLYNEDFLNDYLYFFLDKQVMPVEYKLNLSSKATWLPYTNFNYEENSSSIVSSMYVKSDAGLYVIQSIDDAGNTQTKIFIIDKSSPVFVLENLSSNADNQYELLTQNNTITEDSKVIWGKNKIIQIPKNAEGKYDLEDQNNNLYKDNTGSYSPELFDAFRNIVCGENLANAKDKANISYMTLPYSTSHYSSYYLCVEINDDVYFKNYNLGDDGYAFVSGNELDYNHEIVSSYKIYYLTRYNGLYRSTTREASSYIGIGSNNFGEMVHEYTSSNIIEATHYTYNSTNYLISYTHNDTTSFYLYDNVNNKLGQSINSIASKDGNLYYGSHQLTKQPFIDKEGTYTYLLRDHANTLGSEVDNSEKYLSYPSAYQYIKVSADESQLRMYFIDENKNQIDLADSSYYSLLIDTTNKGTEEMPYNTKNSFLAPTNEDKIYISFKPTIISGETRIQVDKVTIEYYEFATDSFEYLPQSNHTTYNFYKTLKDVWGAPVTIYSYEEDGALNHDETFIYDLNVSENKTKTGFYVVTRSYVTEQTKAPSDTNTYIVTSYDYHERSLSAYVDRYNVISQSETIAPTITEKVIKIGFKTDLNNVSPDRYYSFKYYLFEEDGSHKYLYIPYKRNGEVYELYAYDVNNNAINITSLVNISFKTGPTSFTKAFKWTPFIQNIQSRKGLTDSNGTTYLLIDFSSNFSFKEGSNTYDCIGLNDISIEIGQVITSHDGIQISSCEAPVSSNDYISTSTQSLVGGNMIVTMYSKYNEAGKIISISNPDRTSDKMMLYNNGDSFYTREDTSNITDLTSLFNTNKLPISIAIPKYKFTTYYTEAIKSKDGNNIVYNYVYETDPLSYYLSGDKNSSITSYELAVEVDYYKNQILENSTPDAMYRSNGTVLLDSDLNSTGYLALYSYSPANGYSDVPKTDFTEAGNYVVRVTQANNEVSSSSYNFKSTYSFRFAIENNKPQFDLYGGTLLKSIADAEFYGNDSPALEGEDSLYYTNKDEISVVWTDSASIYKANIDKNEILLAIEGAREYNGQYKIILTQPENANLKGIVKMQVYNGSRWIDITDADFLSKFTYTYSSTTLTNTLSFKLKDLQMNVNNARARITMQLTGHDDTYYEKTTKTIYYDQTASNDIVSNLHSLIYSNSYGLNISDIREYYLADGVTVTADSEKASFNQTISSGTYAKYAFTVTKDFFDGLKANIKTNIDNGFYTSSTYAYFKYLGDSTTFNYASYIPTSNTYDFVEDSNTHKVLNSTDFTDLVATNTYYEIVEKDLAGNITIYLVYVCEEDDIYFDDFGDTYHNGITYLENPDAYDYIDVKDSLIKTNKFEINNSTSLQIKKINLHGDEWNYFYTSIYNQNLGQYLNSYYLATPECEDGYVYKITGVANKTYTKVPLTDIFNASGHRYKDYIYILNKLTGEYEKVAFSLSNTAHLTYSTGETGTTESNSAYFSISLPSNTLTNENLIKALPIAISIVDRSSEGDTEILNISNDPNTEENLKDETYSYLDNWINKGNSHVAITYSGEALIFTIPNVNLNTKLSFTLTDNFGNVRKEIYLVGETQVEPIASNGNLYTYNTSLEDTSTTAYVSSSDIKVQYNTAKYYVKANLISEKTTSTTPFNIVNLYNKNINYIPMDFKDTYALFISQRDNGAVRTLTFESAQDQYDIIVRVDFFDVDTEIETLIKSYYIRLYKVLPNAGDDKNTENDFYFTFTNSNGGDDTNDLLAKKHGNEATETLSLNGKSYTVYSFHQTFSDELKIAYSSSASLDFPYEVLYYSTIENWQNGSDFVPLASGTNFDQNGIYYILVRYSHTTVLTQEYYLFKIEILGSSGGFYYILSNGVKKELAGSYYSYNGSQFSEYYIVNIGYENRGMEEVFKIVPNDYQNIKVFEMPNPKFEGRGIYTYRYLITNYLVSESGPAPTTSAEAENAIYAPKQVGISPYKQEVFVTFLNPSSDILSISNGTTSYLYYKTADTSDTYVTNSTRGIDVTIYEETADTDSMTISWRKYYGITANLINVYAEKDGRKVNLNVKQNGDYFYTELDRSGAYTLRFEDKAGNVQAFFSGQKTLPVTFIKDVHFTVEYTNPLTGLPEETEMINKAIYNSSVKLKLNKLLIPYYQTSSFGSGNVITVTKNGEAYTEYQYSDEDYSFTFSETGFYTVYMTAYNQSTGKKIRSQIYSFTIINARESRYAFEFSGYKNYYIQSIIKDGIDITERLYKSLKTNSNYTMLDVENAVDNFATNVKQNYLKNILISYFDEKTGSGRYQITICANDALYVSENHGMSTFTFEFYINSQQVPISVSLADRSTTNSSVTVNFNAKNVYETVGECYVVVGKQIFYVNETTLDNQELILGDDEYSGTHYIQVYTMSGNLLFSHRIDLEEPMNTWTIIAIIVGVLAAIAVILIIIKLRKRMSVK